MKKFTTPELKELNINATAHNIFGTEYDQGYIGDGHLGLLQFPSNDKEDENKNVTNHNS